MKNCKTFYKAQTASHLKEIIASTMQFLGLQKWCSANDFLLHQAKTYFLENYKVRKVFGCVVEAYYSEICL